MKVFNQSTYKFLSLLIFLLSATVQVSAENKLFADDVYILAGKTTTLNFYLDNDQPFYGFQADFSLPEGLTLLKDSRGEPNVKLSSRFDDSYSLVSNVLGDGTLRVGTFSTEHKPITGNSGLLFSLEVQVSSTFKKGYYKVSDILFIDRTDNDVRLPDVTSEIFSDNESLPQITLNQTHIDIYKDNTYQLTAQLNPGNVNAGSLIWESNSPEIASVSETGLVTGHSPGVAVVSVKLAIDSRVSDMCVVNVITRTDVTMSFPQTSYTVTMGEDFKSPELAVNPASAKDAVKYSSSNERVAIVEQDGSVTILASGTTIITAEIKDSKTYGDSKAQYTLNVLQAAQLSFPKDTYTANIGLPFESPKLSVTPEEARAEVKYSSSNPSVATVEQDGSVKILAVGTTVITAEIKDSKTYGNIKTQYTLNVSRQAAQLSFPKDTYTANIGLPFESPKLSVTPEEARAEVKYSSSNPSVATVEQDGSVKILAVGTTIIKAEIKDSKTYGNIKTQYTLNVSRQAAQLSFPPVTDIVIIGMPFESPMLTVTPEAARSEVKYSSSKPSVATVEQDGTVTILALGTTIIKAEIKDSKIYNDAQAYYILNVGQQTAQLSFPKDTYTANIGLPFESPKLTVTPEEARAEVKYSSSNPSVATVEQDGSVTILTLGTTTITAEIKDSKTYTDASAQYTLTVKSFAGFVVVDDVKYQLDFATVTAECIGLNVSSKENMVLQSSVEFEDKQYPVRSIGEHAFYNNGGLIGAVTIPSSVTIIKMGAFSRCGNVKDFIVEDGDESIHFEESSLYGAPIEDLYLGRNWTSDEWVSISTGIKTATIGEKVTELPSNAFEACVSLTGLTAKAILPPKAQSNSFENYDATLYVPAKAVDAYKKADYWKNFYIEPLEDDVTPGDLNGDGVINTLDLNKLISYITTDDDTDIVVDAADVTGDGVVNTLDINFLISLILNN